LRAGPRQASPRGTAAIPVGDTPGLWRVSWERARAVASAFRDAAGLVDVYEAKDPQYRAVEEIVGKLGLEEGAAYVVGVAIVSYQLASRGEEHWLLAARHARRPVDAALRSFVAQSPSLARLRARRMARVNRFIEAFLGVMLAGFDGYSMDLHSFWRDLSRALGADARSKTIAFAVKMMYYALKVRGAAPEVPFEVPIPVDYRVCLVSLSSGVVTRGRAADLREDASALMGRRPGVVREAWGLVSGMSLIPPLRIDSVLWLTGGAILESRLDPSSAMRILRDRLGLPPGEGLIRELLWRLL